MQVHEVDKSPSFFSQGQTTNKKTPHQCQTLLKNKVATVHTSRHYQAWVASFFLVRQFAFSHAVEHEGKPFKKTTGNKTKSTADGGEVHTYVAIDGHKHGTGRAAQRSKRSPLFLTHTHTERERERERERETDRQTRQTDTLR